MMVYRLTREKHAQDLSSDGPGGRWHPKGLHLIYTAESRALAAMELAIRLDISDLPEGLVLVTLEVAKGKKKDLITALRKDDFPVDWDSHPYKLSSQRIGVEFVKQGKFLAIKVPSAAVKGDFNYLINPIHPEFNQYVKIKNTEPFGYEHRLGKS